MKRILLLAVITGGLCASSALAATMGTLEVGRTAGTFGVTGGEFTITLLTPAPERTFQSFCLEIPVRPGGGEYSISTGAIPGGNGVGPDGVPGFDPVSIGTAWLFAQFSQGTLAGYDYTIGPGREASAYALQLAIWNLEDETAFLPAAAKAFLDLAQAAFPSQNIALADNGDQHVFALNISDPAGNPQQSMLIMAPDGGLTIGLLGLALMGLGGLRRKLRG